MRTLSSPSHSQPTLGDDHRVMRSFWKIFVALALMLPLGAFVAGTLVASAADDPEPRNTIIIDDQGATPTTDATPTQGDDPTETPSRQGDAADDHGDDSDELAEVTPSPDDWGDDNGDDQAE